MPKTATDQAGTAGRAADASVGPLERGLTVLRTLASARGNRLRPSDLVRATGLARSPVDRIAATLVRLGHLREEDGRDLVLTPKVLELGLAYLRSCRFPETLGPLADALADELDESVSVAVPDDDAVRFVVQTPRRRALSVTFRTGDALPAERCAPGALFAAEWDERRFERWHARVLADPENAAFPALPRHTAATGPGTGTVPCARGRNSQERLGPGRSAGRARAGRRRRAGTGRIRERRRRAQRGQPHQPALGSLAARPGADRDARHSPADDSRHWPQTKTARPFSRHPATNRWIPSRNWARSTCNRWPAA